MQNWILSKIAGLFMDKKRVIGWVSAVGFVIGAAAAAMNPAEFREAVCGAPVLEAPKEAAK